MIATQPLRKHETMVTQATTNDHRRSAPDDTDRESAIHSSMLAAALGRAGAQSFLGAGWLCAAVSTAGTIGPVTPRPITLER